MIKFKEGEELCKLAATELIMSGEIDEEKLGACFMLLKKDREELLELLEKLPVNWNFLLQI